MAAGPLTFRSARSWLSRMESDSIVETLAPAARMLGGELAVRLLTESAGVTVGSPLERPVANPAGVLPRGFENPEYRQLLLELGHEPATLDELVQRTGQSAAALSSLLLMLELEARIESLPGNRFQRLPDGSFAG